MTMITMESQTPREKNAGPAAPVLNLQVIGRLRNSATIKTALETYAKRFIQEENQTKNNWYHRVSRRSSAGTGTMLDPRISNNHYNTSISLTREFQFHTEKVIEWYV
jgi:hypothetical protein